MSKPTASLVEDSIATKDLTTTKYSRDTQIYQFSAMSGRAGATASVGYTNTGVDTNLVTLGASATNDTWVIPIIGLHEGDVITAIGISGQAESAGNAFTVDYDLRATTAAAGDCSDAEIQSGTQLGASADTELAGTTAVGTPHTVIDGESYYMLITCTTAASTDIQLQHVTVTVNQR